MEKLFAANILLMSMLIAMPIVNATGQSPKEVEEWIRNLDYAKPKVTKLHFYIHDRVSPAKNITSVTIASANNSNVAPYFGVLNIADDEVRVGREPSSRLIGYAQGFYATTSLTETTLYDAFNIIFTDGQYKGSSISLLGRNVQGDKYREHPIIGGTGVFRMAQGVVTFQTYSFGTNGVAILDIHVIALHY